VSWTHIELFPLETFTEEYLFNIIRQALVKTKETVERRIKNLNILYANTPQKLHDARGIMAGKKYGF